ESRRDTTRLLSDTLAKTQNPPKVLVNASADGFYGDQGDTWLTEDSPSGKGFLAEVCREWESATNPAQQKGIRVVHLRIGLVLSPKGGALKKMLTPFKLGLGGVIGTGKEYISWITLDDLINIILFSINNDQLKEAVNAVTPNPVTNYDFTKTI